MGWQAALADNGECTGTSCTSLKKSKTTVCPCPAAETRARLGLWDGYLIPLRMFTVQVIETWASHMLDKWNSGPGLKPEPGTGLPTSQPSLQVQVVETTAVS